MVGADDLPIALRRGVPICSRTCVRRSRSASLHLFLTGLPRPPRAHSSASVLASSTHSQNLTAIVMVELSNAMEAIMTNQSRRLARILLIVLPTVMFGGVSILSLFYRRSDLHAEPVALVFGAPGMRNVAYGSSWTSWRSVMAG